MPPAYDVLIVGAGHAGAQAAILLRQQGFSGSIAIAGEEPELPYDRPPLSKEYLVGDKSWERLVFRSAAAWADERINLLLKTRIVSVDAAAHRVTTAEGASLQYGKLIWATGGSPRRLTCAGSGLAGIHTIRSRADVDRITSEMPAVHEAVIIGGGYIGLEAAAALIKIGKRVTLIEALARVLARVAGEPLSRFFEREHRAHGVDVRLSATVERISGAGDRVTGVSLSDGTWIPAQMVIVGIGIVPVVETLIGAGAVSGNGLRVDGQCRTSLPDIFAIGDCAEHRNSFVRNEWVRLESVQNANDQANIVARAIMGATGQYLTMPWFWSNQYDLRLQTLGLAAGHDDIVVRGDLAARSFSLIYLRRGVVIALDCINRLRDYVQGRALVTSRLKPDRSKLEDASVQLKTLIDD